MKNKKGPDRPMKEVEQMPNYEHEWTANEDKEVFCERCKRTMQQARNTICDAEAKKK